MTATGTGTTSQPATEGFVTAAYPADGLNRVLPLVKWAAALPHLVIGAILFLSAVPVVFLAGAAIFFTGRYPEPLFRYVTGVQRYVNRGVSYAMTLTTDRYPPLFKLSE